MRIPLRASKIEGGTARPPGTPRIELVGATKRFGEVVAVSALDLAVAEGEILALLGPSGSGKTTVLRLIAGLERPDAGVVRIAGRVVSAPGVWIGPERRDVGVVFQEYALFPHLTVAQNVGFGLLGHARARRAERARVILDLVGLAGLDARYPHELSGGQQQRVALARALAPSPLVVLLDEPFSNLDADLRARTREEVSRILREARATAVFVTHDQEEAFAIATRVAILESGRLEQVDQPEALYRSPATRFVAEFVVRGDVLPASAEGGLLTTEIGTLSCPPHLADGAYDLMLRPDDVEVHADAEGDAVVLARTFAGTHARCRVRLASGRTLVSRLPEERLVRAGDRVRVTLRAREPIVFPAPRS